MSRKHTHNTDPNVTNSTLGASWYDAVRARVSRGSQAKRPGSLAGLHEARRTHQGQFFTPDPVAALLWRVVSVPMERALAEQTGGKIALLDNSVGSGRLLQFADPAKHTLSGTDIDAEAVAALASCAEQAGFERELLPVGMETVRAKHFSVGLINPPFSIHIENPLLEPYPCTTFGKFGPNTGTVSHHYAIFQALAACDIVVAIVPRPFTGEVDSFPELTERLQAILSLPAGSFRSEGTDVATSVLVFGRHPHHGALHRVSMSTLDDDLPPLDLNCRTTAEMAPSLRARELTDEGPAITLPVTNDTRVRIAHSGRKIALKFHCGLTQATVLNAIYQDRLAAHRIDGHRYPKGIKYLGEKALDLETHLVQDDPQKSFRDLLRTIEGAGGSVVVDTGLRGLKNYLARRCREKSRQATPFRRTVYVANGRAGDAAEMVGRARKTHPVNPKRWGSPLVKMGEELRFERDGHNYRYTWNGEDYTLTAGELAARFEIVTGASSGWQLKHRGKLEAYPAIADALRARAVAVGIDKWLNWKYQPDDLLEVFIQPRGSLIAWDLALGKARLAIALCLLSEAKTNLVVLEPHLVDEMLTELDKIEISKDLFQVIREPSQLDALRKINIITYERLRSPIVRARSSADHTEGAGPHGDPAFRREMERHRRRQTYARALRRRIGTLVADEGDVLRNIDSDQTRALWQLSPRRRFVLTGTPVANYPRDLYPALAYVYGDGVALQPYGIHQPYLEPALRHSTKHAVRGQDAFREHFITFDWVTNEFAESLTAGAKREIPRIKDLNRYRAWVAPLVKRRVAQEPEVSAYVHIPIPTREVIEIDWDARHLSHYLEVAEEFSAWYRETKKRADEAKRGINLVAVLARIRAVEFAANCPQHGVDGFGAYVPLTSKQRYAVQRIREFVAQGHKTILYAQNPEVLERLHRELAEIGIESVVFHGGKTIKERTKELNRRFRFGPVPVLLASIGCTQTGLNIPQASRVIFYDRAWYPKAEEQAGGRVLRGQQTKDVLFEFLHIVGSIDEYKAQLVAHKADAAHAGLDDAEPELCDVEFLHLDTVLNRFCEDLARLRGVERHQLRQSLRSA